MATQKFQHPDGRGFSAEAGSDEAARLQGIGYAPVEEFADADALAEQQAKEQKQREADQAKQAEREVQERTAQGEADTGEQRAGIDLTSSDGIPAKDDLPPGKREVGPNIPPAPDPLGAPPPAGSAEEANIAAQKEAVRQRQLTKDKPKTELEEQAASMDPNAVAPAALSPDISPVSAPGMTEEVAEAKTPKGKR